MRQRLVKHISRVHSIVVQPEDAVIVRYRPKTPLTKGWPKINLGIYVIPAHAGT